MALTDIIKDTIDEYLRDPLAFPEEFRSWVPQWTETVGITVPRSSVTGAYTTADTVGELGEPVHGRPCMIRVGSSAPYDFVQMTFDQIANLWVSTQTWAGFTIDDGWFNASTTYIDMTSTYFSPIHLPSLALMVGAGLRPQVMTAGLFRPGNSANTAFLRSAIYEYNNADTALSAVGIGGEISYTGSTTPAYKSSGWGDVTFSPSPTETNGYLVAQSKITGGGGIVMYATLVNVALRWVADPA